MKMTMHRYNSDMLDKDLYLPITQALQKVNIFG